MKNTPAAEQPIQAPNTIKQMESLLAVLREIMMIAEALPDCSKVRRSIVEAAKELAETISRYKQKRAA